MAKFGFKNWVLATRPWSFPASAMPVVVSTIWMFVCRENINWWMALLSLLTIILVHASGNVWSDYQDYAHGVDREDTYGVKTLTDKVFTPRQMLRLSFGLLLVSVILGLIMVNLTGLPLLWIGIGGIALSLLYPTMKYHALGDLVILLCYSVLPMLGMTYILGGYIDIEVLWIAIPIGMITMAILHVNNTRDIETDKRAKINTLPIMTGRSIAVWIYVIELLFPYLWLILLVILGKCKWPVLLAYFSLPIALQNVKNILTSSPDAESFIKLDESTAKLQLVFSLLFTIGLLLSLL